MKHGFYFDLDGTLVDSADDLMAAAKFVLGDNFTTAKSSDQFRQYAALGVKSMFDAVAIKPLDENDFDHAKERFLNYYHQHINEKTVLYQTLDTLLMHLQEQRIPHGIVTNKPIDLSQTLMHKILPQWNGIIIGDQMANQCRPKPHPDRILKAIEMSDVKAENCFYFGDHPTDITAAKSAGCHAVAVRFGFHEPDNPPENWHADTIINTPQKMTEFVHQQCQK